MYWSGAQSSAPGARTFFKVVVHDADDGVERVVEARPLGADDAGVASEAALPESVAEDGDVWAAEDVVGGLKAAADDGRDAQAPGSSSR